eukprot:GHVH01006979.1.p1 GENE.GHVH01006979.1~~GHVH01006979.1.p1  ORF type:complete len:322 (-),score=56.47 GHVH01006979.1:331-1296(-)
MSSFCSAITPKLEQKRGRSSLVNIAVERDLKVVDISKGELLSEVDEVRKSYDYKFIDDDIGTKIAKLQEDPAAPIILFVGKYLWTKGIHTLIMAFPEVIQKFPAAKLVIAGFGPFREPAEILVKCLSQGTVEGMNRMVELIDHSNLYQTDDGQSVAPLIDNIKTMMSDPEWIKRCSKLELDRNVFFTGILDHQDLSFLLPSVDVLVAPSVFPEAFGMVAIEAMACGVYPVLTYQSAFCEIVDLLQPLTDQTGISNVLCELNEKLSHNISSNIVSYIEFKRSVAADVSLQFRRKLREIVVQKFSWEGIAMSFADTFGKTASM